MLKRIHYISSFVKDMSVNEIKEISSQAAKNNAEKDITGVLMAKGGVFFQIIEGPEENIDRLFTNILKDIRHEKIITLGIQIGDLKRLFPNWHMKEINLDTTTSERLQPVKAIIDAVHAQAAIIENLTEALAASAWAELLDLTTKD
ncbi:MAG: BLUF domain-containing protein [Deltaproteobacteria bacterium]|nr:BLUF domain-containing protein [Deltaproteobacteria bacterium]MBW2512470.1 BLUF domain-containing protein [Deltaproteobacteria bacterium]